MSGGLLGVLLVVGAAAAGPAGVSSASSTPPESAAPLEANDRLELTTADGDTVRGWVGGVGPASLLLTGSGGGQEVVLSAVVEARRNGQPLSLESLAAGHAAAWAQELTWVEHPPPHPRPASVAALSVAWAGAGHARLGEWGRAGAWAAVDLALVGAVAWSLAGQQAWAPALSAGAVDLVVRGAAASSSARTARRRRDRIARARALQAGAALQSGPLQADPATSH